MALEPDGAPERLDSAAVRKAEVELEELLFTLEICRRALGWDAHPEHFDRLRRIEGMVRWSLERDEWDTPTRDGHRQAPLVTDH
jgi:hypothetical protein